MDGSQVEEGKKLLMASGLNVQCADNLGDGAQRIVKMLDREKQPWPSC